VSWCSCSSYFLAGKKYPKKGRKLKILLPGYLMFWEVLATSQPTIDNIEENVSSFLFLAALLERSTLFQQTIAVHFSH
jgi:hypothetical protein